MTRALLAALAVAFAFAFAAPLRADDEKKDDKPKERADQLKELEADFKKAFPEVVKEWRAATSDGEREKALAKVDPLIARGIKIVEADPKDAVSLDTLMFLRGSKPEPPDQVVALLGEHHANNEKLHALLPTFAGSKSAAVQSLLRAVMAKAESKDAKGTASFVLAKSLNAKAESAVDAADASKFGAEAEALLEKASKEYGDVKLGRGSETIKEVAEKALFEIRNLSIGKTAPEVISKDLEDKETKLTGLRGKVVVLDIWATWCPPCRAMIPHEREMVERLKDKPFALVSISADDKVETLKEFLEKEKMPWTHWWEGRRKGGIINDWNIEAFPTIYVIDHKGVIRHKGLRGEELEKAVAKLVAEAEKK